MKKILLSAFLLLTACAKAYPEKAGDAKDKAFHYTLVTSRNVNGVIQTYTVIADDETGCQYFDNRDGLTPRLSEDGKTVFGCHSSGLLRTERGK